MASQLLRIQMSGGGPYGFRLLGGDNNPLTVAKIRPSSKSQVAGLLEGDVILAINNICSQGLSHAAATSLMESSNAALTVHALRGRNALSEVDSAMATLGSEVKRLTAEEASALVPNSGPSATSGSDQTANGSEPYFRLQAPPTGGSLKQMRIARRESRESPDDVVGQTSQSTPGYYAREERKSTDGGKTTRIVEEVKTEKFGGTTLTKVTKQEFSSYKSSDPFPPEFSVIRSEEREHPVPLGATSSDGGNQLRDERGWKTSTSVHKSSVRTEPYEIRIDTTQEPTKTYVIYQDGSKHEIQGPDVGRVQQQPVPAIEIKFHPNESGYGVVEKPSRVGANPNFEIRVGNEVTFQPKSQTTYGITQSHSELRPILKVHDSSIPSQSGAYSKFSNETSQTSYGNHPQFNLDNEPQSGYLIKQTTRTQLQSENDSQSSNRNDTQSQFGNTAYSQPAPRPQVRFSAEPDYSYRQSASLHPHSDDPDPRSRPETNHQYGYTSDPHSKTQSDLEYNPKPHPNITPKFERNSEHPQHGFNQEPQPEINSQFGQEPEPQPRTQSQYGYQNEPQRKTQPQFGHKPETQHSAQPQYGCDPEHHHQIQPQYGYNQGPQSKLQSQYGYSETQPNAQSQYGVDPKHQTHPQYGYKQEPQPAAHNQYGFNEEQHPSSHPQFGNNREPAYPYKPRSHVEYEPNADPQQSEHNNSDSLRYRPEQGNIAAPQYGYTTQQEPQFQSYKPTYNPDPKYKVGAQNQNTYETGYSTYPPKASTAPFSRQLEAQSHDSAPAAHTPPAQWGKTFPHEPAGHVGPSIYNPPEEVYDTKPPASDRRPIIPRQLDRTERVEIGTAPKWTPGSKLPTKQPSKPLPTYGSNPPRTGSDPRGLQLDDSLGTGGYHGQPSEGGVWHEATVAEVKNRPNVAFSRVHDPTKQSAETEQSFEYGSGPPPTLKYGSGDYYPPQYGREEEGAPGGQYGWSASGEQSNLSATGRLPAQGNTWRPSGYGPSAVDEMDRSRGIGAAPPPPAPPLAAEGYFSTQPYGFCVDPTPPVPPPPAAPPIDNLKVYRGHSKSDGGGGGYGLTTLEERVKMANSVAHSVLAPENQNSRGQKIFLRRRENSHKWTTQGPDPVPERPAQHEPPRSNLNAWAPKASASAAQPRPLLVPPGQGPQQLQGRPTYDDYSDINGRPEEPSIGGTASPYSLAEDMTFNSGKGGRLFAKRRAKADQWTSAESTGRQMAPQNIRPGAPPSQAGYGLPAQVPSSPGYEGSSSYGGAEVGKGGADYPVTNRLSNMVKQKNATVAWTQQAEPQSPFAQSRQSTGPSLISVGSNPNPGAYRQVRFQGVPAISSPAAQPKNFMQAARFTPKQFGNRAIVSQTTGYTDL